MILYGLKSCDTSREALKVLPEAVFVDVRAQGVPGDTLAKAADQFGAQLVNARSTTWRELSPQERQRPALELLEAYPTLMKRPLIVKGDQMLLGWTPQTQEALGARL